MFFAAHANDPFLDVVVALFQSEPAAARAALDPMLTKVPADIRLLALEADVWRDEGRFDDAADRYRRLIRGTSRPSLPQSAFGTVRPLRAEEPGSGDPVFCEGFRALRRTPNRQLGAAGAETRLLHAADEPVDATAFRTVFPLAAPLEPGVIHEKRNVGVRGGGRTDVNRRRKRVPA